MRHIGRIGVLTIGHSPRPDLVEPLQKKLPLFELIQVGALDHLTAADLPQFSITRYPLSTRLRDGTIVQLEEKFLEPLLQNALDALETEGIMASILMCAGSFCAVRGRKPLFKPFSIAREMLTALGIKRIGVVAALKDQERATEDRWCAAGFYATVFTARLDDIATIQQRCQGQSGVVLDYVGHSPDQVAWLRRNLKIPVVDLGGLAMSVLAQMVA